MDCFPGYVDLGHIGVFNPNKMYGIIHAKSDSFIEDGFTWVPWRFKYSYPEIKDMDDQEIEFFYPKEIVEFNLEEKVLIAKKERQHPEWKSISIRD